ncbi:hypothetical protein VKT23_010901 [Stygiomarasmius scandens]
MVEEAIRNGTYVPGMFGPTPGAWRGAGAGGRGSKVDLGQKPRMWEAYLGVPSSATANINNVRSEKDVTEAGVGVGVGMTNPLSATESGSSRGGGGYGGGFRGASADHDVMDWEGIMPFSASLATPLPTSLPSSSTSAGHGAGASSTNLNNSNSHNADNADANRGAIVQRIGRGVLDSPRTVWGLISTQSTRRERGNAEMSMTNTNTNMTTATATTQGGIGRFLRRPSRVNDNTTNSGAPPSTTNPNTPNPKAKDTTSPSDSLHQTLPSTPTISPIGVQVSVLIAMPSPVPLSERLSRPRPRSPNAMEDEEELPYLEMGVAEVVVPPEVDPDSLVGESGEGKDGGGGKFKGKESVDESV